MHEEESSSPWLTNFHSRFKGKFVQFQSDTYLVWVLLLMADVLFANEMENVEVWSLSILILCLQGWILRKLGITLTVHRRETALRWNRFEGNGITPYVYLVGESNKSAWEWTSYSVSYLTAWQRWHCIPFNVILIKQMCISRLLLLNPKR